MLLWMAVAQAACEQTTLNDLAGTALPAIFVLGERPGMAPDVPRVRKLMSKLTGPVTLGLQVVPVDKQPVLDAFSAGQVTIDQLEERLEWSGPPFKRYKPLFESGVRLRAVGVPQQPKPVDTPLPLPPGYAAVLIDGMSGHPMPAELESSFVQTVAWMDHRIAKAALDGWNAEGALVIVADRLHVEGGKGIAWQAQWLTQVPVQAVLLEDEGRCYPGDRHL